MIIHVLKAIAKLCFLLITYALGNYKRKIHSNTYQYFKRYNYH